MYIRPLYLRSAGGRIPELKRVIVAYQNHIVMEETLEAALNRLFPPGARGAPTREAPPLPAAPDAAGQPAPRQPADELSSRALDHYRRAIQAQREGNWGLYGDEIRRLGEVLEQMRRPASEK